MLSKPLLFSLFLESFNPLYLGKLLNGCFCMQNIAAFNQGLHKRDLQTNELSKGAKIRNRYNQVPHLTQGTNGKVTNSQIDTTNESREVSPFPAGGHKAHINRRAQRHSKHKTEKHKRSTKEVPPWNGQ